MPSISTRLGLVKPSRTDQFVTSDIANNWQKLDAAPGAHICTSTTRPTWGSGQAGRLIMENDTNLLWRWTGTAFTRVSPMGMLRTTSGSLAQHKRTTDFWTEEGAFSTVLTLNNVVVPAGGRPIQIVVNYPRIMNALGLSECAIIRSATNNGTPIIDRWPVQGDSQGSASDQGSGGTRAAIDVGLSPGTYNYTFQVRSWSGGQRSTVESGTRTITFYAVEL